jgi:hypothetical protein
MLHEPKARDEIARSARADAYVSASIDALEGRLHVSLVDARTLEVLAADPGEPIHDPALESLAGKIVDAAAAAPGTIVLLPTRDDGLRVSNLGTASLDLRLSTELARAAARGVHVRTRIGVLERLRQGSLEIDRLLAGGSELRVAFQADFAVAALYDAPGQTLRAGLYDLREGPRQVATLEGRVVVPGYAVAREAARFTVDERCLRALVDDLEVARVLCRANLLLNGGDVDGASGLLEALRARSPVYERNPHLMLQLASVRRQQNRPEEAFTLYEAALAVVPAEDNRGVRQAFATALLDEAQRLRGAGTRRFWFDDRDLIARSRRLAARALDLAPTPELVRRARELAAE